MSVFGQRFPRASGSGGGGGSGLTDPMTTRGDIIVRNASNATARLPVGTAGQILTSDGTDTAWDDPAGGSGGNAPSVDDIPVSPNSEDEEFATTDGFAWVNQGAATAAYKDHTLCIVAPASSVNNLRIRSKAIGTPTGDWRYRLKLSQASKNTASFLSAGFVLRESGTGKIITFTFYSNNTGFQCDRWSAPETYVSTGSGTLALSTGASGLIWFPMIMEVEKSGSNLIWRLLGPLGGEAHQIHTETVTNHFTTRPDEWGVFANTADSAQPSRGIFAWGRRLA